MLKKITYLTFLIVTLANSQNSIFDEPYGFVSIESDSINIPIYIDGDLIGHTPIQKPVPLIIGSHYIDIKPISISNPFTQHGAVSNSKNIYVFKNDTISIVINPYLLRKEDERVIKEKRYSGYIGLGLGLLTLLQLWIIS
tara:strand:+ start:364 stop:783 length:420 start_codon:yes stop_codon:yes gene_type:complete